MNKSSCQTILDSIRGKLPLRVKQIVGPFVAYIVYFSRIYIWKNPNVPKVLSIEDTIDLIMREKLSIIRFGDGEMSFINNCGLAFQGKNQDLALKLKSILQANLNGLLICTPNIFGKISGFTKQYFWFIMHHLFKYGHIWNSLLDYKQIYGDAYITRPYLGFTDKSKCEDIFKRLFFIWENKNVVLIEGEKSRLGVGNDMFDNVKSMERILCPAENAYSKYDEIKTEAMRISKDKLVLISLGPTAKVLAYDLFLLGYRVIDIGHIDMEYEMFLRKETRLTKVKYKYFNEIGERNPEDCRDVRYLSQIIANIK